MNKTSAHEATSLPEPIAGEAAVDPAASLPDFPAERPGPPAGKPKRMRKPRAKVATPPTTESGRPILHIKSSTARRKAEPEAAEAPVAAPATPDHETFELTGAPDAALPVERATPQQIEIPELQTPSPSAEDDGRHLQNGDLPEAAATPSQTVAPPEEPSFVEPAQIERADLNGSLANGNLHAEPQIENRAPEPPEQIAAGAAAAHGPLPTDTSQPEPAPREIESAPVPQPEPEPFEDPRFTYVPRWRREALPDGQPEQDTDDGPLPAVADPEPQVAREPEPQVAREPEPPEARKPEPPEARVAEAPEAREQAQVAPAATPVEHPRKTSAFGLRAQLILIALTPIVVGAAIAFLTAFLSPTLFAARSEVVVNVTSMDWSSAERFLATQLVVVKARSTLQPISEATAIPLRDLEKDIRAELIGSSDVISIQYANSDPSLALTVVKAVTAQYLINLRDYEQVGSGMHRVLMPATVLEDPVSLKPLYAALIGAVVGFAIGVLGIVLRTQLWRLT